MINDRLVWFFNDFTFYERTQQHRNVFWANSRELGTTIGFKAQTRCNDVRVTRCAMHVNIDFKVCVSVTAAVA